MPQYAVSAREAYEAKDARESKAYKSDQPEEMLPASIMTNISRTEMQLDSLRESLSDLEQSLEYILQPEEDYANKSGLECDAVPACDATLFHTTERIALRVAQINRRIVWIRGRVRL
jgi:hypothetical protein